MSGKDNLQGNGLEGAENATMACLVIALAVYLVRIMPWALSEYWYDEVLTLSNFALDPDNNGLVGNVLRNYPIANNHILSTAIYWTWLKILNYNVGAEHILRLPSILFGAVLVALPVCHWRKWLGPRAAALCSAAFAISPVFTAYAYQIRGYSLSMLLAGIGVSGALECLDGNRKAGLPAACAASLLLPLVIPSNILMVPALCAIVLCSSGGRKSSVTCAAAILLSGIAGGCYYLTIWNQFLAASREPGGWRSPWLVAGNLLLALFAHCLVPVALLPFFRRKAASQESPNPPSCRFLCRNQYWAGASIAASALAVLLVLLVSRRGQAPYPRVFLVFLPVMTASIFMLARPLIDALSFPLLSILILCNGLAWERISTALTDIKLKDGISPSNLLQQYYRGQDELRSAVSIFIEEEWAPCVVITDEYDQPTMSFYWLLSGGSPGTVVTRNLVKKDFYVNDPGRRNSMILFAVAKTPCQAAELLSYAGLGSADGLMEGFGSDDGRMVRIAESGIRGIYIVRSSMPGHLRMPRRNRQKKGAVEDPSKLL